MNRAGRVNKLNPIFWVAAKTDLDCVMIEIWHNHRPANVYDSVHEVSFARGGYVDARLDCVRIGWVWAIGAAVGRRLRNVVIGRPLTRFRRIDRVDAFFDNVARAIVVPEQAVRSIDLQFLPDIVWLGRHALCEKYIRVAMIGWT